MTISKETKDKLHTLTKIVLDQVNFSELDSEDELINEVKKCTSDYYDQKTRQFENPLGYNPYKKDHYNLTDIINLEENYPKVAKRLEEQAKWGE